MNIPLRVLLIEDSEDDAALLTRELRRGGYEVKERRVDDPEGLASALDHATWDLIFCDYSMPHFSGMDALRLLRAKGHDTPFIFVSGTIGEDIAIEALTAGANDYLMKGNLKRLIPSVRRELREVEQARERKRLEENLQQMRKFEEIGRLAGGIAHDFNNSLGVIIGWSQIGYEEMPPGSAAKNQFQKIYDVAQRCAGLTSQLLAFARRQILQPKKININSIVSGMEAFLTSAIGASVTLNLNLAPDLQLTNADPTQIEQIIMNLCLNARDAMPSGGHLILETQNTKLTEEFIREYRYGVPGEYVSLFVSDNGMGMDEATVQRIFEPFFTTKELGKGTGLGLATVYGIVKQHGGFINVFSEIGSGTTFRIYLPATTGAVDVAVPSASAYSLSGIETILIADDFEPLRELASAVLGAQGYKVLSAGDGEEAVKIFQKHKDEIGLVLLDVSMPVMGGRDTYSQIKAIRADIPVIFSTGHTSESASLDSELSEGAIFIQKPYSPQTLTSVVRAALDRKPA